MQALPQNAGNFECSKLTNDDFNEAEHDSMLTENRACLYLFEYGNRARRCWHHRTSLLPLQVHGSHLHLSRLSTLLYLFPSSKAMGLEIVRISVPQTHVRRQPSISVSSPRDRNPRWIQETPQPRPVCTGTPTGFDRGPTRPPTRFLCPTLLGAFVLDGRWSDFRLGGGPCWTQHLGQSRLASSAANVSCVESDTCLLRKVQDHQFRPPFV